MSGSCAARKRKVEFLPVGLRHNETSRLRRISQLRWYARSAYSCVDQVGPISPKLVLGIRHQCIGVWVEEDGIFGTTFAAKLLRNASSCRSMISRLWPSSAICFRLIVQ